MFGSFRGRPLILLAFMLLGSVKAWAAEIETKSLGQQASALVSQVLGMNTGREIWAGADVYGASWLLFSGLTYAPLGGIYTDGPRIRLMTGYGSYVYERLSSQGARAYEVKKSFTDMLAGYQHHFGALTAKAFLGFSMISHDISPTDLAAKVSGEEMGVKAMIELWINLGEKGWASLDAGWARAFNTTNVHSRIGYHVMPGFSLGLEAGITLDENARCGTPLSSQTDCTSASVRDAARSLIESGRGGLFTRIDWPTGEASLSVGALGDELSSGEPISGYVTA